MLTGQLSIVQGFGEDPGAPPRPVEIADNLLPDSAVRAFVGLAEWLSVLPRSVVTMRPPKGRLSGGRRSGLLLAQELFAQVFVGQLHSSQIVGADVVGRASAAVGPFLEIAVHVPGQPGLAGTLE